MVKTSDVLSHLTAEQIEQLSNIDMPICGCGTFKQALDIATKNVAAFARGNDCGRWFVLVNTLESVLYQNMELAKFHSMHPDASVEEGAALAERRFGEMDAMYLAMVSVHQDAIAEKINGPIKDAHNEGE